LPYRNHVRGREAVIALIRSNMMRGRALPFTVMPVMRALIMSRRPTSHPPGARRNRAFGPIHRSAFVLSCAAGIAMLLAIPRVLARADWQMAAPLPAPMGEIMGAVVGGKWYVMAGLDPATHKPLGVVDVFDPAPVDALKSMAQPAHLVMVAVLSEGIYVFGGFVSPDSKAGGTAEIGWKPIDASWVYDTASDTWNSLARMPTPRGAGWAVESNGKIYVIGGAQANIRGNPTAPLSTHSPQLVLGTVEEYDPAADRWRTRAPIPTPRNHLIAAAVGGKIYAIGGRLGSAQITAADDTNVIEEYDPAADQWMDRGRAPIRPQRNGRRRIQRQDLCGPRRVSGLGRCKGVLGSEKL
jgi:hypothetical protein